MEIKGPFSYSGNKYKIMKAHLYDIISKYDKIHEPFLGSGVCLYNSNKGGIGIDTDVNVIALHNSLKLDGLADSVNDCFLEYFPNGRNEEAYLKLRKDFNEDWKNNGTTNENAHMLHLLIQLSFNSLLRFSRNGYNVPFGRKEADIERIRKHQKISKNIDMSFINGTYSDLPLENVNKENDIIYLDPPYLASKFTYGGWNEPDEIKLLDWIDQLNEMGYKFILSNTLSHRGVKNQRLVEWCEKYTVKYIDKKYNAWAAAVGSVSYENETSEVIVSNFSI
jgi:DNA adenine methylase Dam